MTDPTSSRRLLVRALLDPSAAASAAAGREWLAAVDLQLIGHDQARMLPMLYKRLHTLGVEQPPLLRGTYRKAWVQNQMRFRAAAEFLDRLQAVGVASLVLKGASLVPAYGGDWGLRDMSDVDALVAPDDLERALQMFDEEGWTGLRGVSAKGVAARFVHRRHSWNFSHPDGHQVDLHWRVFATSRDAAADRAFWSAAVPLRLGPTRAMRLCDGDLLLHVLEHAGHDEENSRVQWAVDSVMLLRATTDLQATAERLAEQAASHGLLADVRERLAFLEEVTGEPRVAAVLGAVAAQRPRRRRPVAAARTALTARFDGSLIRSRWAWALYVGTGRRAWVERLLCRRGAPLCAPVGPAVQTHGWLHLWDGAVVDALCGPGFSFPESGQGVWTDGVEARMLIPRHGARAVVVELSVLPRHGGDARTVEVRVDGRSQYTLDAPDEVAVPQLLELELPTRQTDHAEIAFLIRRPARPVDLGLNADPRELGVLVHRIRITL